MNQQERILVTGASGYIGKNFVRNTLEIWNERGLTSKDVLMILSCSPGKEVNIQDSRVIQTFQPIFSRTENLYTSLGSPTSCIHLAWKDGFRHNSDAHMKYLSDHVGFCTHLMRNGIKRMVVLGTMQEIGYWKGMVDENTPCSPLTQYGIAKNALRQSLLISAREFNCKFHWLRAFYITGEEKMGCNVFSKILEASERGEKTFPFTSGLNKYDFVDINELSRMILAATFSDSQKQIINVCSGKPIALADKVEAFIAEKKLPITLLYGHFPDRKYDSPEIWGDPTEIRHIMLTSKNLLG